MKPTMDIPAVKRSIHMKILYFPQIIRKPQEKTAPEDFLFR